MKILLEKEMETLLIPLYGRAQMSRLGILRDEDAERAAGRIDYDFSKLRIPEKTQVLLSIRSALIDDFTKEYLKRHPNGTVVYLGCGLDFRAKRLGFPAGLWYDLDFPQVIRIKRQLCQEMENYRYIPSSVTDPAWMNAVDSRGGPVLVIAEGLMMYLCEQEVSALLLGMRDRFGDVMMILDVYSRFTAKHVKSQRSLKKTGAAVRWGVDSPKELEAFGGGITHVETMYLTDPGATEFLPEKYRRMFKIAARFKAAREAHRIFVVKLAACAAQV